MNTGSPHMQNDDGMDDSDSPQDPVNIHHFLNYEVVYINSFNTHNLKIQDSGNNNNCGSPSSCCLSIVSDKARPFIRSTLTVATSGTTPWRPSLAKFYFHAGSIGSLALHCAIFVDHSFILSYLRRYLACLGPRWSISTKVIDMSIRTYFHQSAFANISVRRR